MSTRSVLEPPSLCPHPEVEMNTDENVLDIIEMLDWRHQQRISESARETAGVLLDRIRTRKVSSGEAK